MLDTLEALQMLHDEKQLVHRDIKPANICIAARGQLVLIDFGTAAPLHDVSADSSVPAAAASTPWRGGGGCSFSSKQLAAAAAPAISDDLHSLAYTAVFLLCGSLPWDQDGPPPASEAELQSRQLAMAACMIGCFMDAP